MFLQLMWFTLVASSVVYAGCTGQMERLLPAMLAGCEEAIVLTFKLGGGYLLFCGLIEIAKAANVSAGIEKCIRPALQRLMPHIRQPQTREAVALNVSMNLLGIGNAATPLGIEAVERMEEEEDHDPEIRQDIYMLLILSATSLQLLPTTVLTLRAAAGSSDTGAVLLPTLLCTAFSSATGAGAAMLIRRIRRRKP